MKEKKEYIHPKADIIKFKRNDIITNSGDDPIKAEEDEFPDDYTDVESNIQI